PIADSTKDDAFWLDPADPHRSAYIRQGVLSPTVPNYPSFNPGYAEANAQQIWGAASADVIREGMTPQAAAEKALGRLGAILAKYLIAASGPILFADRGLAAWPRLRGGRLCNARPRSVKP